MRKRITFYWAKFRMFFDPMRECGNCKCWHDFVKDGKDPDEGDGACRRRAPQKTWPVTHCGDWCAEGRFYRANLYGALADLDEY